MEQWNNDQIEQVQLKNNVRSGQYTLKDIFDEDWKEKLELESEIDTGRPDNDSEYRDKLNRMFRALFDCDYSEILVKDGNTYRIGEAGRTFLKLILKLYRQADGKRLRDKKYREIDFEVTVYVLYCATRFLKEREFQDENGTRIVQELCEKLKEKFELNDGTYQLMNSLHAFTVIVEKIVAEKELSAEHETIADMVDDFARELMREVNFNFII